VRVLLIAAALLVASTAAAEPLTLEQALARAEEVSVDLRVQTLSVEAAESSWLADPRAGSPSIRVRARDLSLTPNDTNTTDRWDIVTRLRLPLPRPWDLETARVQGQATAARERAQLSDQQADLHLAVKSRFELLPLLRDAATTAEELTSIWARHRELVAQRRMEGLSTALEWLESEEEHRDADDDRAVRTAELVVVEAELRTLLAWGEQDALEVNRTDLFARADGPLPGTDELLVGLLEREPSVREADADLRRAEAQLRREQLRSLPWLDWMQAGVVTSPFDEPSFEVGVAVDVPIYYWSPARTRGALRDVQAARIRTEDVRARAVEGVTRRLRQAEARRERWLVERRHRDVLAENAEPLIELADPLLKIELEARMTRADLRVQLSLADLIVELNRLEAAAAR
jgi:outer membrane protein TolC